MRKLALTALVATIAPAAAFITAAAPAHAQCPGNDGTIPGTAARATAVGPLYIDDRDWADLDDDGDAGGLWIYLESNGQSGLQRGGDYPAIALLEANGAPGIPRIDPVETPAGTLFPNGFGGGGLAESTGMYDDCVESTNPDTILV